MTNKKRVIIVDDQALIREGLAFLLGKSENIEVVGEASNGKEFLEMVGKVNPDAVIMDINMPVMNGIEATSQAVSANPDIRILAFTMFGEDDNYFKMIQAGARGFILKTSVASELERAILEIASNGYYTSEEVVKKITGRIKSEDKREEEDRKVIGSFSKNELQTLKLIAAGYSDEDIAKKQKTGVAAARSQRAALLSRTGCNNSASLTLYAIRNNVSVA